MNDIKAFPHDEYQRGMGLRDYFAAQAMLKMTWEGGDDKDAVDCYRIADAMLKARTVKYE